MLFIHDSIYQDCPEKIFEAVPGQTCVKRVNYELKDIFNFEPEFKYAKTVIISCGINDLARYHKTANSLADLVCSRLAKCCEDNPDTNFIFNCLTLTRRNRWLNKEIDEFNVYMYNLSRDVPNLSFFDSHALIKREDPFRVWEQSDYNGIKLVFDVRRMVTRGLVNCVGKLTGARAARFRDCRWLCNTASGTSRRRFS